MTAVVGVVFVAGAGMMEVRATSFSFLFRSKYFVRKSGSTTHALPDVSPFLPAPSDSEPPDVDEFLCRCFWLELGSDRATSTVRVFDGLETAVLTAVLDDEDDFRLGAAGRVFRDAVVRAAVVFVATIFRRPRGGRSNLGSDLVFRAFLFLRPSFDDAESSSLTTVVYDA